MCFSLSILNMEKLVISDIPDQRLQQCQLSSKKKKGEPVSLDRMQETVSSILQQSFKLCSNLKARCFLLNQEM